MRTQERFGEIEARNNNSRNNQRNLEPDSWNLQGSENPRACLVINPITYENYNDWSRAIKISLSTKERLDSVTGPNNKPTENDPRFKKWKRCNSMVNQPYFERTPSIFSILYRT